jgi:hypothetical protein
MRWTHERSRTLVIAMVVLCAGLLSRRPGLPAFVTLYAGDVLWGAFFFQLYRLAWPALTNLRSWLLSVATTELIELSQLWQAPWLVAVRGTRLGGLLLGHQFLVSDMVCVALGASAAALLRVASRNSPCA